MVAVHAIEGANERLAVVSRALTTHQCLARAARADDGQLLRNGVPLIKVRHRVERIAVVGLGRKWVSICGRAQP
jgi:hypothetical protein